MSKSENNGQEHNGPTQICPFCEERKRLRDHLHECPESPHTDQQTLSSGDDGE